MEDRGRSLTTARGQALRARVRWGALGFLALWAGLGGAARAAEPVPAVPADDLGVARAALWEWRLTDAETALAASKEAGAEREVLLAQLDLQRSRFREVVTRLGPLVEGGRGTYGARVLLGRAYLDLGEHDRGIKVLDALADDYNADRIKAARDLMWLGVALHWTDYVKNANRVFKEALDLDGALDEARLYWADLFLAKYNYRDSDGLLREVLTKRPDDVRANVGAARVAIESDRAFAEAGVRLGKVLTRAPECVPAHNLLALVDLQNERLQAAAERLESQSLRLAPNDPEALALLGATYYLMDDTTRYRAVEKRALGLNPRFAAFYTIVADHAEREHRYAEAIALLEKALTLNPEFWDAVAALGTGYSRIGDDDKAKQTLQQAFDGDPYNVKTYNLLAHFYDDVEKNFAWVEAGPFRLRVNKREKEVLARYVPKLLNEAYGHFTKKYGFKPKPPLHVEIFNDTETFAVRSTGLPGLAAHGICFGHVITARSPSAGNFNWAEVLWHELAHTYHIQLSDSRVPRWFTEGMAVFESTEGRPEWEREMDLELRHAFRAKTLRGAADFDLSFTQAKSIDDILVAYYQAYEVARFIHAEWGFAKLKRMLELWGKRKTTPDVFRQALGIDIATFDTRFFAWLGKELAYLDRAFPWELASYRANAEARIATGRKPDANGTQLAEAAAAALATQDEAGAASFAERAVQAGDHGLALFVRGGLRLAKGDKAGGKADFEAILAAGGDALEVRQKLAALALEAKDLPAAATHLEAAIALNPKDQALFEALIRVLETSARKTDAYAVRVRLARVDQMDVALASELLAGVATHGGTKADVLHWGERTTHIAPFSAATHVVFAKAAAAFGLNDVAQFEAESALLIDPQNADARAILGR